MGQGSVESGGRRSNQKVFSKMWIYSQVCEEIESNDQIDTEFEELVQRIDGDASSADYIDADDMVPFCREPIDLSNEEWRSLLRNEVLSIKTDEHAEPVEKNVCVDSDSEEECVDAEPARGILSCQLRVVSCELSVDFCQLSVGFCQLLFCKRQIFCLLLA